MALNVNAAKLKELLKSALAEVLEERRDLVRYGVLEAFEQIGLINTVEAGEGSAEVVRTADGHTVDLGAATLEISVEPYKKDSKFNCKVVFHDLDTVVLHQKGYLLLSCETRRDGRDTPVSIRAWTYVATGPHRHKLPVTLRVIDHHDASHYNAKIVFDGLEQGLVDLGLRLGSVETREGGQGTPLATRAKIVKLPLWRKPG